MALSEIGTASGSTTSGTCTVTLTASPAANDIILIFITYNNASSGSHPVPSISGFTSLGSSTGSVWSRTHCFWKYAAGSEGTSLSVTHTGDVGVFQVATGLIIRGGDSTQPTNVVTTADATSNTTVSIAAITTAANNSWDIVCAGYGGNNDYGSGASYSSWGTSLVEKADAQVFGGGAYYAGLGMAYVARATAGAQSSTTVTQTGTDVASVIRLEIKEAASGGTSVTPGAASLTLTGYAPTVATPTSVTPAAASLTLTGRAPTAVVNTPLVPAAASLSLTGYAPTVAAPTAVTPGAASLTLTGYAPTVSAPTTVTPGVASLTLTGYAPTVSVSSAGSLTPAAASLTLTGYAPTVATPTAVTPGVASLVLTGYAPTVATPVAVTPDVLALVLTGYAPTVTATQNANLTPTTATLVLTGYAPAVDYTGQVLTPLQGRVYIEPYLDGTANIDPYLDGTARVGF